MGSRNILRAFICLVAFVVALVSASAASAQSQKPAQAQPSAQTQPPVSISSISASFFPNPTDSGAFISTPSTAVTFTQDFPTLNFNPPAGTVSCNPPINVNPDTTPLTDVVPQPDGTCKTIQAQGNKQQAAVGDLRNFQAVFTGQLQVSAAGRITFNIYSDDGWILSIGPNGSGAQPGYVSGPMLNFPRVGPFTGYTIVGSYNVESAPNQNNLVVGFPAAGSYPFELDYSDCCSGTQALTVLANSAPIPPASGLSLDVKGLADAAQVQGQQHVEVVALSGQPRQVELLVDGKTRGIVRQAPFAFDWDTTQETVGPHTLVFRGTDATGAAVEKQVTVQVARASAAAAATPLSAPTPLPAATTTIPANNTTNPLLILAAVAILLLALGGAMAYFFLVIRKSPAPKPAPVVAVAEPVAPAEEKTEFIGKVPLTDLTMVSNRRPQQLAKAKLLVKPDREIQLSRATETVIGRDSANAAFVDDRQVSRHHARISCVDGDFWIEDLNSTNGTRVNGATITRQKLANNDQINVGDTIITFAVESS